MKQNFFYLNDAPKPWGLFFQDSASPQMEALIELHDIIFFYLMLVLFMVGYILLSIIINFFHKNWLISNKYLNHGTLIELIWTISPAIVLIFIAFPSFKLLFLVDDVPNACITINVTGLIFYGLKLYIQNKIKDASFTREKNNTLHSNIFSNVSLNRLAQIKDSGYNFTTLHSKRSFHTSARAINRIGPHPEDVISCLIGGLLGNANANARTIDGVRFCYRQSIIHQEYLIFLYQFFYERGYCSNLAPRKYTRKLVNKTTKEVKEYYGYEFNTFTFRSFKWIYELFYKKGKKIISPLIEQYLTPLALAVWIMDDGGFANPGVRLATYCFSLEEVKILVNILTKVYSLNCTIQNVNGKYNIYITKESIPKLREIVLPHIVPSMLYKLNVSK